MNIFYLDEDIKLCSEYHCDKHVVKMILEYSQQLCTAHRVLDGYKIIDNSNGRNYVRWKLSDRREEILYQSININHPCNIWVRSSDSNYIYLYFLLLELLSEYSYRYNKVHRSSNLLDELSNLPSNICIGSFTEPYKAMPEMYKIGTCVESYRNYYINEKLDFCRYTKRDIPYWLKRKELI